MGSTRKARSSTWAWTRMPSFALVCDKTWALEGSSRHRWLEWAPMVQPSCVKCRRLCGENGTEHTCDRCCILRPQHRAPRPLRGRCTRVYSGGVYRAERTHGTVHV